jgi:hypothetical protein
MKFSPKQIQISPSQPPVPIVETPPPAITIVNPNPIQIPTQVPTQIPIQIPTQIPTQQIPTQIPNYIPTQQIPTQIPNYIPSQQIPTQIFAQNPAQNVVQNSVQNVVQNPVQNVVQNPVQNVVQNPLQNVVQNPVQNAIIDSISQTQTQKQNFYNNPTSINSHIKFDKNNATKINYRNNQYVPYPKVVELNKNISPIIASETASQSLSVPIYESNSKRTVHTNQTYNQNFKTPESTSLTTSEVPTPEASTLIGGGKKNEKKMLQNALYKIEEIFY